MSILDETRIDGRSLNDGAQIITAPPCWDKDIETTFVCKTIINESLSGREVRVACYHRPLIKMEFTARNMSWHASSYFRTRVETRGDHPTGIPVWMDTVYLWDSIPAGCEKAFCEARNRLFPWFRYALLWKDQFYWDIVVVKEIREGLVIFNENFLSKKSYPKGSYLIPLAFGEMKVPESEYYNPDVSDVSIKFNERHGIVSYDNSGHGYTTVADYTNKSCKQYGGNVNLFSDGVLKFTIEPDFGGESNPKKGFVDDLHFEPIDVGTPTAYSVYEAERRKLSFNYIVDRYDLQWVIAFWEYVNGRQKSFLIPSWFHDATITQEPVIVNGEQKIVIVRNGTKWKNSEYKAFFLENGEVLNVSSTKEANCHEIITPETPVVVPDPHEYPPGHKLSEAINVRFEKDELTVICKNPDNYNLNASFVECDDSENLSKVAYLYKIQAGIETMYYANYGYTVVVTNEDFSTNNYVPADITHDKTKHTEEMMGEDLNISVSGTARDYILSKKAGGDGIVVTIYRMDFGNTTLDELFKGVIVETETQSYGELKCSLSSNLRILERNTPSIILQRQCNYRLFGIGCNLLKENWTISALVNSNSVGGYNLRINSMTSTNSYLNSLLSQIGFLAGATFNYNFKTYMILKETSQDVSSTRVFTLNDRIQIPSVRTLLIYPYCSKSIYCCKNNFNNVLNFGGCPWIPNNNPLDQISTETGSGGKKSGGGKK